MKREYILEQKAGEIAQVAIVESSAIGIPNDHIEPWVKDFAIGVAVATAKWADSHPQWIPVEERLPPRMNEKSRFSDTVHVYNKDGYKDTAYYDFEEMIWRWMPNVTHWMPLPTPPKKDGNNDA
jgi:hypothetical protein